MARQRRVRNLIVIFLLTLAVHPALSSSQNPYEFTTTIDVGGDYGLSQAPPSSTATSIYQDTTTNLPTSTSVQTEEILDTSETNFPNRHAGSSRHHEGSSVEDDDPEETANHAIPYSEHEEARDVPTRPRYVAPGVWAKPPPEKNVPLDFVPTKLHAQVRGTHTVKRLPRREAIENAESDEDKRNAPRLRKVVTNSKVNTVYTEEGYEDSAYDHAGHLRDADFHEGFAHKLHDRRNRHDSSSGKRKMDKHPNLVPEEFEEYEEDYRDHPEDGIEPIEASENAEVGPYEKNIWEGTEIDPKLVVEDGVRKLENAVDRDAAEAERSSKDYRNAQESKLHDDIDSSEELNQGKDDSEDGGEENEPIKTKKKRKKKSKSEDEGADCRVAGCQESKPSSRGSEQKKKKKSHRKNHATTSIPSDGETSGLAANPVSSQGAYSFDETSLRYVAPVTTSSLQQIDESTTVSYSQLFWDYFKGQQAPISPTTESSTLAANSTIPNPRLEKQSPIAVATIDGRGPYLLVTKQETATPPFHDFHSQDSPSGHVEFDPNSAQVHTRRLLGQNDDQENGYVANAITATSTVATFTSVQPLLPRSASSSSSEKVGRPTSTDPTFSSTPAVATLNITQEAYSQIADYHENPFLGPVLDNSNIALARNRINKYKVLVRPTKKIVKPVAPPQASFPREESEKKRYRDELNAKYAKMLDHVKSKQKSEKPPSQWKKLVSPQDLTLMRPPIPQQIVYPIFSADRPSLVDHSSVTIESESPRREEEEEEANWRGPLQDGHSFQSIKPPYRFDPFPVIQPVRLNNRKDPFPATELLPPSPFANIYASHRSSNDHHFSFYGKPQQQQRDNVFRHFPREARRTHFRRKRSGQDATRSAGSLAGSRGSESGTFPILMNKSGTVGTRNGESGENAEDARKAVIDRPKLAEMPLSIEARQDGQTNAEESSKRNINILRNETRPRASSTNKVQRESHEELLNESPKISGDVIDKEIAARFNVKDGNETSTKIKENEKVEVDVPSFDHVDELLAEHKELAELAEPATTEFAVDLKKYPFYKNENVPSASALKYVVDPRTIPQKTARGMEFYESRNVYKRCDEVEPNLDKVLPKKEEPDPDQEGLPEEDLPRLRGLGDKLDCFKAKYFDENPLDNPLFAEKSVEEPTPPSELDPTKFASRILVLPEENDDYVVQRLSKKPERQGRQWRNRNRPYETHESLRVNYKHDPQTGRGRNAYLHTVRGTKPSNVARHKTNDRRSRPKAFGTTTTTTARSPKRYQTAFYQNQVYEDVMGNIRNMANSYQVYETTTLPPDATQIPAIAGSETALKVVNATSSPPKEKSKGSSPSNVTDVTGSPKSSMIKGLVPPPKYSVLRQNAGYRKHRPHSGKSRAFLLRSPSLSRIIAHHHSIKINKRSVTQDVTRNSSESAINETAMEASTGIAVVGNDTIPESKTRKTNELSDLEIEESRQIGMQDRSLSTTLKIDDRKRRVPSSREPQKNIYTIRDRIRYSKPKWDTRGFGKFSASPKTTDEDHRRKEPRYNHFKRKRVPTDDRQNNSAIPISIENTRKMESAMSSTGSRESGTSDVHRPEESVVHQMIYDRKEEPDPEDSEKAENLENSESEKKSEEETESTTNTYQVHENIDENMDEDISTTTTSSVISKEVSNLREYLDSDPAGYAEAFPEETTTPSSEDAANYESDEEKQQDEENNHPKGVNANPWDDDSSEKAEEQMETPKESSTRDDDSGELSSGEEEGSNKQQTFFTYRKRPTSAEGDDKEDEEGSKKASTFHEPFPFSRYKSKFKKESDENESEEEDEEKSEDYVFPWHADKGNKRKRVQDSDRYEYPWERRERLAKERREKRKRANRFKKLIFDDEDEEESTRDERPVYPWEKYNVPSKNHVNARRDITRVRHVNDNEESSSERQSTPLKYNSKYSSDGVKPFSSRSSKAREISRSIKKILDEDTRQDNESKEDASRENADRSPSLARKSERGIFRGMLVPENITQPPRRKTGRQRVSRVDENASINSHFNSRRLKSKEADGAEEDESAVTHHLGPNKNKDKADPMSWTTSSQPNQLLDNTTGISSPTGQRRKRRRRILKNNSTISVGNFPVKSTTEPGKRRRKKSQASANMDLETSKSVFIPVRRKYSEMDKTVKTGNFDSTEKREIDPVETSTPKTETIERRSRISKEKIVTKTVYPDEEENFDPARMNATRKGPVEELKTRSRRRKNNVKQNDNGNDDREKLMMHEDEDYDKFFDEDKIKRSAMLKELAVKSKDDALKDFGTKKVKQVKKINDFNVRDRVINDENNDDFATSPETYAISNLLRNALPNRARNDLIDERTENKWSGVKGDRTRQNDKEKTDDEGEDENAEETRRPSLLHTKYIKDPERRLYYYVE